MPEVNMIQEVVARRFSIKDVFEPFQEANGTEDCRQKKISCYLFDITKK